MIKENVMIRTQRKRIGHNANSRPADHRPPKATVPPRRPRRPRPAPEPIPKPAAAVRPDRFWKPVCPTAHRAFDAELFVDLE
ncbi:hypothetical protein ACFV4G_20530 [Kitasatospora sp. NPDC059747]|uniref:hypothetical protein n=1 Tax=Kitasatospora sp. NPDC059747 TaxID=3346930 RepID=UPI00365207CA